MYSINCSTPESLILHLQTTLLGFKLPTDLDLSRTKLKSSPSFFFFFCLMYNWQFDHLMLGRKQGKKRLFLRVRYTRWFIRIRRCAHSQKPRVRKLTGTYVKRISCPRNAPATVIEDLNVVCVRCEWNIPSVGLFCFWPN